MLVHFVSWEGGFIQRKSRSCYRWYAQFAGKWDFRTSWRLGRERRRRSGKGTERERPIKWFSWQEPPFQVINARALCKLGRRIYTKKITKLLQMVRAICGQMGLQNIMAESLASSCTDFVVADLAITDLVNSSQEME